MDNTAAIIERNSALFRDPVWVINPSSAAIKTLLPIAHVSTANWGVYRQWSGVASECSVSYEWLPRLPQSQSGAALCFMPKVKRLLTVLMSQLSASLQPGTPVYLVGSHREGIKSANTVMSQWFDNVDKVDSARHCVIWQGLSRGGAPSHEQDHRSITRAALPENTLELVSYPGVFNRGHLDDGTALLLTTVPKPPTGRVLDFGCGNGIIGTYLKTRNPQADVVLCDNDAAAIAASRATLAHQNLQADVVATDVWSDIPGRFDAIYTNPPFHQGVKTDYRVVNHFIQGAQQHLHAKGQLFLVANAHLQYEQWLTDAFAHCSVLAQTPRFRVYQASLG